MGLALLQTIGTQYYAVNDLAFASSPPTDQASVRESQLSAFAGPGVETRPTVKSDGDDIASDVDHLEALLVPICSLLCAHAEDARQLASSFRLLPDGLDGILYCGDLHMRCRSIAERAGEVIGPDEEHVCDVCDCE